MGATRSPGTVTGEEALAIFAAEACSVPRSWANGPGDRYGEHSHDYHKVLFCLTGSIVFHVDGEELELTAGDRLDIEPGTMHSATVGSDGCECVEASR